mmetsp:Transcript_101280/g.283931  ORF Transcript_101280/g.283931 Transcript_101280/m.283931 type:complete len:207 (+) Transcript_101280:174-794(+)
MHCSTPELCGSKQSPTHNKTQEPLRSGTTFSCCTTQPPCRALRRASHASCPQSAMTLTTEPLADTKCSANRMNQCAASGSSNNASRYRHNCSLWRAASSDPMAREAAESVVGKQAEGLHRTSSNFCSTHFAAQTRQRHCSSPSGKGGSHGNHGASSASSSAASSSITAEGSPADSSSTHCELTGSKFEESIFVHAMSEAIRVNSEK